jgi:hypothetical protein
LIKMIIMRGRLDLVLIVTRMLMGLLEGGGIGWRWMIVGRGDGWFLIDWESDLLSCCIFLIL